MQVIAHSSNCNRYFEQTYHFSILQKTKEKMPITFEQRVYEA